MSSNRSKNKVVKSVSFNITNEEDVKFLEHIGETNFSGYVKDLIREDVRRRNQPLKIVKKTERGGVKIDLRGSNTPPSSRALV
ncbi:hypothetical protein [Bacillus sp. 1P02SD]|uniref:hypothetical protein n=1 Tax=Bacillus sp. 1P02SD TaxID=3132264 RepID=UPI0039A35752